MSDLSDLQVKAKKIAKDLRSDKDLAPEDKKKLQTWMDKITDRLDDLAPRKDQLSELISGIKSLEDEIKKFNTDQGPLLDNASALATAVGKVSGNPKTKALLSNLGDIADKAQKAKPLKNK